MFISVWYLFSQGNNLNFRLHQLVVSSTSLQNNSYFLIVWFYVVSRLYVTKWMRNCHVKIKHWCEWRPCLQIVILKWFSVNNCEFEIFKNVQKGYTINDKMCRFTLLDLFGQMVTDETFRKKVKVWQNQQDYIFREILAQQV